MMQIKEIEFNDDGKLVHAKGTFTKGKKIRVSNRIIFSKITNKIIHRADLNLDYCGD
jgi:hypothetical protein